MRKAEKSMTSPWITLAILSGLGIIAMSAETMVLPAIPDFIVDLDISYEVSSWILAAPLVTGGNLTVPFHFFRVIMNWIFQKRI